MCESESEEEVRREIVLLKARAFLSLVIFATNQPTPKKHREQGTSAYQRREWQ